MNVRVQSRALHEHQVLLQLVHMIFFCIATFSALRCIKKKFKSFTETFTCIEILGKRVGLMAVVRRKIPPGLVEGMEMQCRTEKESRI